MLNRLILQIKRNPVQYYLSFVIFTIVYVLLWKTNYFLPLRIFAVTIHECMHIIGALITGGDKISFTVRLDSFDGALYPNGKTFFQGGNFPTIAFLGYLGTTIYASLMLLLSSNGKITTWFLIISGVLISGIGWTFGSGKITIIATQGYTIFCFGLAGFSHKPWIKLMISLFAWMLIIYSIFNFQDYFFYLNQNSDAYGLALHWSDAIQKPDEVSQKARLIGWIWGGVITTIILTTCVLFYQQVKKY